MKKLLLFTMAAAISAGSFAQNATRLTQLSERDMSYSTVKVAAKGTATGDTAAPLHILATDTVLVYYNEAVAPYDSGYTFGSSYQLNQGFAERYEFDGIDSSVKVIGIGARFIGGYAQNTTRTVTLNVYSQGAKSQPIAARTHLYLNSKPSTVLGSTAPLLISGIGMVNHQLSDTNYYYLLQTATSYLTDSFYVGFEFTNPYTWASMAGDTVCLVASKNGERHSSAGSVSGADTILNGQNSFKDNSGNWHDIALELGFFNHLFIYPVLIIKELSVNGVTKNNLTFFGNYPNPAVNNTNIKYAVKRSTDITVQITDLNGRVINTVNENGISTGEHILNINTSNLPTGNYIYTVRTKEGDTMACQFSVVK